MSPIDWLWFGQLALLVFFAGAVTFLFIKCCEIFKEAKALEKEIEKKKQIRSLNKLWRYK